MVGVLAGVHEILGLTPKPPKKKNYVGQLEAWSLSPEAWGLGII